jgi:hypothetical protein
LVPGISSQHLSQFGYLIVDPPFLSFKTQKRSFHYSALYCGLHLIANSPMLCLVTSSYSGVKRLWLSGGKGSEPLSVAICGCLYSSAQFANASLRPIIREKQGKSRESMVSPVAGAAGSAT